MRFEGRRVEGPNARPEKTTENDFDAVFWPFSNAACCSLAIKNDKKRRQSRFLSFSEVARWALSTRRPSNRMLHVAVLPQWKPAFTILGGKLWRT